MAIPVVLKNSTVKDKTPQPTDLLIGELAVNANQGSPALYLKDTNGAVVKIAGPGAVGTTVPAATDAVQGIVELATQAEVDAGTDAARAVTPATLKSYVTTATPDATETTKGIVELATVTEAETGTDTVRAVTPAGLKAGIVKISGGASATAPTGPTTGQIWTDTSKAPPVVNVWDGTKWVAVGAAAADASETVKGIVELATLAEAEAGTDTVRAVTPAGLKAGITKISGGASNTAPTAPSTGQIWTDTSKAPPVVNVWDGTKWVEVGATPADASETVKGIVELATAAETTTGTDTVRAVTPAGLKVELDKQASLASPALTGTPTAPTATSTTNTTQIATTAFVHSLVVDASETVKGLVELATTAEVLAGTDTARAVTPKGLKDNYLLKDISLLTALP